MGKIVCTKIHGSINLRSRECLFDEVLSAEVDEVAQSVFLGGIFKVRSVEFVGLVTPLCLSCCKGCS